MHIGGRERNPRFLPPLFYHKQGSWGNSLFEIAVYACESARPLWRKSGFEISIPPPATGGWMKEKLPAIVTKRIGDTIYIVESTVSDNARETPYEKVKRLILNGEPMPREKAC